ncbi:MAG: hypothetical protein RR620_14570, partial [Clostridium sp.]
MEKKLEEENIKNLILGELDLPYKLDMVDFSVEGKDIDSLNCIMNMLGYPANKYDIGDRAYYEALANNIEIKDDEVALRCNIVKVQDEKLIDFTGGNLPENILDIVSKINIPKGKLYHLDNYKNLLVLKKDDIEDIKLYPPHFNIGNDIKDLRPENKIINKIIQNSKEIFSKEGMEGNILWPWGISQKVKLPSFEEKHNNKACVIAGIDLVCGIAKALGLDYIKPKGATGYEDTNLNSKLQATIKAAKKFDLVVLHINGLDELAHKKQYEKKLCFLDEIKKEIIIPLIESIDDCKLIITSDHRTDSFNGEHEEG